MLGGKYILEQNHRQPTTYIDSKARCPVTVVTKQIKNVSPAVVLTILRHFFRLGFGSAASKAKKHTIHNEIGKW